MKETDLRRVGIVALLALALMATPAAAWSLPGWLGDEVSKSDVEDVYQDRCSDCHPATETSSWTLDTLQAEESHVEKHLTEEQREKLEQLQTAASAAEAFQSLEAENTSPESEATNATPSGGGGQFAAEQGGPGSLPGQAAHGIQRALSRVPDAVQSLLPDFLRGGGEA